MSHPKNNTTPIEAQLPKLRSMAFGSYELEGEAVFHIENGTGLLDGLEIAVSLTEGIHQLTHRLVLATNMGDTVRTNEPRALAFLADAANTLNRSAQVALEKWEAQP